VTAAILNYGKYIDTILGTGYFKEVAGREVVVQKLTYSISGYNPIGWLIIFIVLLFSFSIFVLFLYNSKNQRNTGAIEQSAASAESSGKYDAFEDSKNMGYTAIGSSDLFWGLKNQLRKYFGFLQDAHSGVVNDYSLWVVGTLAVISIYLLIVL